MSSRTEWENTNRREWENSNRLCALDEIESFNEKSEAYNAKYKELEWTAKKVAVAALATLLVAVVIVSFAITLPKIFLYNKTLGYTAACFYVAFAALTLSHHPLVVRENKIFEHKKTAEKLELQRKEIIGKLTLESFEVRKDQHTPVNPVFTDEEIGRMKPYFNDREDMRDTLGYAYTVTAQKQLEGSQSVSFERAPTLQVRTISQSDNLQEIQDNYLPWQLLLRDMTAPRNLEKLDEADVRIVAQRAHPNSLFNPALKRARSDGAYYAVESHEGKQVIAWYANKDAKDKRIAKTPVGFLRLLPEGITIERPAPAPAKTPQ